MPNIKEIQDFFFEAMLQGYVDDNAPIGTIAELPGSKTFSFSSSDDKFMLRDTWFEADLKSYGFTIICERDLVSQKLIPVWRMFYWGRYHAEAIPVLKQALHSAYSNGIFLGGRGCRWWRSRDYVYHNCPDSGSGFQEFSGYEEVMHHNGRFLGSHSYEGGIFFDSQD